MGIRPFVATALGAALLVACAGRRVADAPAPPAAPAAAPAPVPAAAAAPAADTAPPAGPAAASSPPSASPGAAGFEASVRPLLARTCTPCHVPGGRMYERLPFDRPEVVSSHKDGILRRLKNPDDRQVLERWLASQEKS